jgi:hypothetical protein
LLGGVSPYQSPQDFVLRVLGPAESDEKVLRAWQFPKTDTFSKSSACISYITQSIHDPCLKSPLALNFFVPPGISPRGTTFEVKYVREFETEFENILGYEKGAHMGSIHEKNQRPKISCYCPFKACDKQGFLKRLPTISAAVIGENSRNANFWWLVSLRENLLKSFIQIKPTK